MFYEPFICYLLESRHGKLRLFQELTDFIKNSKLEHNYAGFYSVVAGRRV